MEQLFIELLDEQTARRGIVGWLSVWLGGAHDLVNASIAERVAWSEKHRELDVERAGREQRAVIDDGVPRAQKRVEHDRAAADQR